MSGDLNHQDKLWTDHTVALILGICLKYTIWIRKVNRSIHCIRSLIFEGCLFLVLDIVTILVLDSDMIYWKPDVSGIVSRDGDGVDISVETAHCGCDTVACPC